MADDQVQAVRRQPCSVGGHARADFAQPQPGLRVDDVNPVTEEIERVERPVIGVEPNVADQTGPAWGSAFAERELLGGAQSSLPEREFPDAAAGPAADEDRVASAIEGQPEPGVGKFHALQRVSVFRVDYAQRRRFVSSLEHD